MILHRLTLLTSLLAGFFLLTTLGVQASPIGDVLNTQRCFQSLVLSLPSHVLIAVLVGYAVSAAGLPALVGMAIAAGVGTTIGVVRPLQPIFDSMVGCDRYLAAIKLLEESVASGRLEQLEARGLEVLSRWTTADGNLNGGPPRGWLEFTDAVEKVVAINSNPLMADAARRYQDRLPSYMLEWAKDHSGVA